MPKISDTPKNLKPFLFHGVSISVDGEEAKGECPFCEASNKFYVSASTSKFQCFKCQTKGNSSEFLKELWKESDKLSPDYSELSLQRGLLYPETLMQWGAVKSVTSGDWLIPAYQIDGKLAQLYKYSEINQKSRLLATPGKSHYLYGINLFDRKKVYLFICEGVWDAMALWEVLGSTTVNQKEEFEYTSDREKSLRVNSNVIAVPGCTTFFDNWAELCADKVVHLLYDSDHPVKEGGTPAGLYGVKKASQVISACEDSAREVSYLRWGPDGYDPSKPSGYDLRDALMERGSRIEDRVQAFVDLIEKFKPVPEKWLSGKSPNKISSPNDDINPAPCTSYRRMIGAWKKAMYWIDGLDCGLSVMLACVASTRLPGDQLWVKILAPPACGKSTLAEAVSVARKYVTAKSTITGFHSGFKGKGGEEEDNSLISKLYGRTLIVKDGDTLMRSPNVSQILSEGRDIYDGVSRTYYRNRMGRDYTGIRMTWILLGTWSLKEIDNSELGERFLDCVIIDEIDDEMEDQILMWGGASTRDHLVSGETDDDVGNTNDPPDLVRAKELTGGYVQYLRENVDDLLLSLRFSDKAVRICTKYAKFISYMRARPSSSHQEIAHRELATRISNELIRLTGCLAVVLNRKSVDDEVLRRVRKVAFDTCKGISLDIVKYLIDHPSGKDVMSITTHLHLDDSYANSLLRFLRKIKIVEKYAIKRNGVTGAVRWKVSSRLRSLYRDVMEENCE